MLQLYCNHNFLKIIFTFTLFIALSQAELITFDKHISTIDELESHKQCCNLKVGNHLVIFCDDGYVAITDTANFLRSGKEKLKAG